MSETQVSIVVMGVCGTGKSTVAEKLAQTCGYKFVDGDDLHPKENVEKMSRGEALNDLDRLPWLENIQALIHQHEQENISLVIVCSALKKIYRDILRRDNTPLFVFLEGEKTLIAQRLEKRSGHFMKPTMLETQLATLEIPNPIEEPDVSAISIAGSIDEIVHAAKVCIEMRNAEAKGTPCHTS